MFKIKYSRSKHVLLLDFNGETLPSDPCGWKKLTRRISRGLNKINTGYTLVEVFRGGASLSPHHARQMGALYRLFYEGGRIWRVIQVNSEGGTDPGVRIFHRTRWVRDVPLMEVESVGQALILAREEIAENQDWIKACSLDNEPSKKID